MFEELLKLFKKENLLDQAFRTTVKMLESDEEMFEASVNSLRRQNTSDLPFDIYEKDKQINQFERDVRRNVLTHMTVSDKKNVSAGLVLISIVIDVERIGDYTKNIAELASEHRKKLHGGIFEADLVEIEKTVQKRFKDLTRALIEKDVVTARQIMNSHKDLSSMSDRALAGIIAEQDKALPVGSAVVLALYFRYLKRIASHLTNIASSVVNPFPRIGFREE
ncbi:MAG: hypothetical protein JW763_00275 [candidate division Zixibacteria bacterium]|nr:hypothetical protein [candidate division Zixibacteria bacterium]